MFPNSSSSAVCMEKEGKKPKTISIILIVEQGNPRNVTHLSKPLINNSKLEVVADHMLIKRDNKPRRLIGTTKVLSQQCYTIGELTAANIWKT